MNYKEQEALVLLSGGQDSTTCLFWAKKTFKCVKALSIDYGQKHIIELDAAIKVAKISGVEHIIMKCPILAPSVLTKHDWKFNSTGKLPNTWVPARNLVFLSLAATLEIPNIIIGACETDYSGYPDCRQVFIDSAEQSINLAHDSEIFSVHAPLMGLNKKETVEFAKTIEGCWEALAFTVTCYNGTKCGACPACELRAKGFKQAGMKDPAQ
jgi:7-cyano-7-deazaguanine synthase